jgi:hypothetical protein
VAREAAQVRFPQLVVTIPELFSGEFRAGPPALYDIGHVLANWGKYLVDDSALQSGGALLMRCDDRRP